jgi:GTPase
VGIWELVKCLRNILGLTIALKIPVIVIVTKIDIAPTDILLNTIKDIKKIIKYGGGKVPFLVKDKTDVINAAKNIKSNSIIPIIQMSNITGFNLDLIKLMMNLLPVRTNYYDYIDNPIEFSIDNIYNANGHPCIVAGLLKSGVIKVNDTLHLGPFYNGSYKTGKS